jgi:hypothetical protein
MANPEGEFMVVALGGGGGVSVIRCQLLDVALTIRDRLRDIRGYSAIVFHDPATGPIIPIPEQRVSHTTVEYNFKTVPHHTEMEQDHELRDGHHQDPGEAGKE